jgi:hypothetical protein
VSFYFPRLYRGEISGFGGLEVACWPLVPKFTGSKPGRSCRIFKGEKILSTPSFGGVVKPSVPCRRFAACKRSLSVTWKSALRQNYRVLFSPMKFHISLLGSLASRRTWRHLAATVGTSKTRGEQGSTTSLKAVVQPGHWLRALSTTTTQI